MTWRKGDRFTHGARAGVVTRDEALTRTSISHWEWARRVWVRYDDGEEIVLTTMAHFEMERET